MGPGDSATAFGFHEPVMVEEVMQVLVGAREGLIMDGTLGGGGHTEAMLVGWPECHVVGVDRDPDAVRAAETRLVNHENRVRYLRMRFDEALEDAGIQREGLDGALFDLGVSSFQLEAEHRGFTFRRGLPLDMRMGSGQGRSASDLLNEEEESELARLFREYGEEPRARKLARGIVRRRAKQAFRTSDDLVAVLHWSLDRHPTPRDKARVFQALRIAVNEELASLERALPLCCEALKPSGTMAVISYHSLEDRIVKEAFRTWSKDCICPPKLPVCACRGRALGALVQRKPIRPTRDEVLRNPRARSARLRAWRKEA